MRLILLSFMVCASALAADPRRTADPATTDAPHSKPKAAKNKRAFCPLKLLRRLGNAESEFALRLSSWGIQPNVEAGNSAAFASGAARSPQIGQKQLGKSAIEKCACDRIQD